MKQQRYLISIVERDGAKWHSGGKTVVALECRDIMYLKLLYRTSSWGIRSASEFASKLGPS
jgi:hypothetical protein